MAKMKVQWEVYHDPRHDIRYVDVYVCDTLREAKEFVSRLSGRYWKIIRQEYTNHTFGEAREHSKGYAKAGEVDDRYNWYYRNKNPYSGREIIIK